MSTIGVSGRSSGARSSGGVRHYLRHCIVGKIQDGRHLSKVKQHIGIILDIIKSDS